MLKRGLPAVELVVVGDELLSGQVVDTNSAFVSDCLAGLGLTPARVVEVPDDPDAIRQEVGQAVSRSSLVFVLGGMGPTPDDKTLEAVAGLCGRALVEHKETLRRIAAGFRRRGQKMPRLARRQALVPFGAGLFDNPAGMVPGMAIEHEGTVVILLPGVPVELKAIMTRGVEPFLKDRFPLRVPPRVRVRTFGIPEATIAGRTKRILKSFPDARIAFYPRTTGVDLVLHAAGRRKLVGLQQEIVRLLGDAVYEVGERSMAEVLGGLLRRQRLTVATAESCTGGLIGDQITNVPGSSDYFTGGVTAYSNRVKTDVLGVKASTLERYGAVSAPTVRAMANGVCRVLAADVGIAVSGIAGPGGATPGKPVGLAYVAVAFRGRVKAERHRFAGSRRMVKERAATAAMDLCRRVLSAERR